MNNVRSRKIGAGVGAGAFLPLAIGLFVIAFNRLIQLKLSLPSTWTIANEGRFVAYGLEQWAFLFTIPIVISLLLVVYLIYPLKFEKFSKTVKILSLVFAIAGFGVTIFLAGSAILNNPPFPKDILYGLTTLLETSPFWIMGILAVVIFKKDKFENIEKRSYKLGVVILTAITLLWTLEALKPGIVERIIH